MRKETPHSLGKPPLAPQSQWDVLYTLAREHRVHAETGHELLSTRRRAHELLAINTVLDKGIRIHAHPLLSLPLNTRQQN